MVTHTAILTLRGKRIIGSSQPEQLNKLARPYLKIQKQKMNKEI